MKFKKISKVGLLFLVAFLIAGIFCAFSVYSILTSNQIVVHVTDSENAIDLSSSSYEVYTGESVTLSAQLAIGKSGVDVHFFDDAGEIGTAATNGAGLAQLNHAFSADGDYTLYAEATP